MTIDQERNYIMQHPKYKNSVKWKDRVLRMPDNQVHAIYMKFRWSTDYKDIEKAIKAQNKDNANYHQVDMFEYMKEMEDKNGVHED